MRKPLPSIERIKAIFEYDPETGALSRRNGRAKVLRLTSKGYLRVGMDGENYMAHRLIWKMMTGQEPVEIDHINGDKADNRFSNLRAADRSINMRNAAMSSNNTSGVTGVCRHHRKWRASIRAYGKQLHLGCFDNKEEAIAARKAAEAQHGYGPNVGGREVKSSPSGPRVADRVTRSRAVAKGGVEE